MTLKYTTGIAEYNPRNGSVIIIILTGKNIWIYLLLVIKGKKTAQANIGVKLGGKPINLDTIKQRIKRQDDFNISLT